MRLPVTDNDDLAIIDEVLEAVYDLRGDEPAPAWLDASLDSMIESAAAKLGYRLEGDEQRTLSALCYEQLA